jgi:hypothetical protein
MWRDSNPNKENIVEIDDSVRNSESIPQKEFASFILQWEALCENPTTLDPACIPTRKRNISAKKRRRRTEDNSEKKKRECEYPDVFALPCVTYDIENMLAREALSRTKMTKMLNHEMTTYQIDDCTLFGPFWAHSPEHMNRLRVNVSSSIVLRHIGDELSQKKTICTIYGKKGGSELNQKAFFIAQKRFRETTTLDKMDLSNEANKPLVKKALAHLIFRAVLHGPRESGIFDVLVNIENKEMCGMNIAIPETREVKMDEPNGVQHTAFEMLCGTSHKLSEENQKSVEDILWEFRTEFSNLLIFMGESARIISIHLFRWGILVDTSALKTRIQSLICALHTPHEISCKPPSVTSRGSYTFLYGWKWRRDPEDENWEVCGTSCTSTVSNFLLDQLLMKKKRENIDHGSEKCVRKIISTRGDEVYTRKNCVILRGMPLSDDDNTFDVKGVYKHRRSKRLGGKEKK